MGNECSGLRVKNFLYIQSTYASVSCDLRNIFISVRFFHCFFLTAEKHSSWWFWFEWTGKSQRGLNYVNSMAIGWYSLDAWSKVRDNDAIVRRPVIVLRNSPVVCPQILSFLTNCSTKISHNVQLILFFTVWYCGRNSGHCCNWWKPGTAPENYAFLRFRFFWSMPFTRLNKSSHHEE